MISRKAPPRPPRPDRSAEFVSFTPKASRAVMAGNLAEQARPIAARAGVTMLKTPGRKDQRIRDSARGEACTICLPGCDGGGETTVWCHLPEAVAGRGLSLKGVDELGAYGCRSCHDIVDRRAPRPDWLTEKDVALDFYRALARSFVILRQKGLA